MCQLPIYLVIIRRVRCAHQMLPDPYLKNKDQPGARAMKSGGNNSDDDDHCGDMPSLMFKEK